MQETIDRPMIMCVSLQYNFCKIRATVTRERNRINAFCKTVIGPYLSCGRFKQVFFNVQCSTMKLQNIYDGIANKNQWGFIGITAEVNGDIKAKNW